MSERIETIEEVWEYHVKPMLKDQDNWKSEIDGMISAENYEKACDALKFFTGRELEVTNVFNDIELKYPVYAVNSPVYKLEE
jgi:hypothetical protein